MADPTLVGFDRSVRLSRAAVSALFLQAMAELRTDITIGEVEAALAQRSPLPIFESKAWVKFRDTVGAIFSTATDGPLMRTMISAARSAFATSPVADPAGFSFDLVFERAIEWLEREGAKFVTVIDTQTRDGVRIIIQRAFAEPLSQRQGAREILKLKGFGLNRPQSASLANFAAKLKAGELPEFPGSENFSDKEIRKMIEKRYQVLRKRRARVVAHQEPAEAASAAQRLLWDEAAAQRQIDTELYVLQWVTRIIRVCPRCIALSGKTAEIVGGTFVSDPVIGGGSVGGTVIHASRPTLHVDCHCGLRIILRPPIVVGQ